MLSLDRSLYLILVFLILFRTINIIYSNLGESKTMQDFNKKLTDKIIDQMQRLCTSVDWNISRFTMDKGLSESVKEVFIDLFNKGLIYKDKRLVNWDPKLCTAVSDLEVNQIEKNGKMWFINYKIENSEDFILVGTTRPETLFGDTAIAIHPKLRLDSRTKSIDIV